MILRNLRSNLNEENAVAEAMKNVQTIIKDFENSARIKKVIGGRNSAKLSQSLQKYAEIFKSRCLWIYSRQNT